MLLFVLNPELVGYKDADNLYKTLLDQIRTLPGVREASYSMDTPLSGRFNRTEVKVEGVHRQAGQEVNPTGLNLTGPSYVTTR